MADKAIRVITIREFKDGSVECDWGSGGTMASVHALGMLHMALRRVECAIDIAVVSEMRQQKNEDGGSND